jgi:hypothetical protein
MAKWCAGTCNCDQVAVVMFICWKICAAITMGCLSQWHCNSITITNVMKVAQITMV